MNGVAVVSDGTETIMTGLVRLNAGRMIFSASMSGNTDSAGL